MDGVLADFTSHIKHLDIPHNKQWHEPRETWTEETIKGEGIKREAMHSPSFWATMPMMPDAQRLWAYCTQFPVTVVTAKPHADSPDMVADEKFEWINKNLGPLQNDRFICCLRSEKHKFIGHVAHKHQILVDDDERNCADWSKAGGIAVLHLNARDSIKAIETIIYDGAMNAARHPRRA